MRTEIQWTDDAWAHWKACNDHARNLRAHFGDGVGLEARAGLLSAFTDVTFAAGPVNIQKDGEGFYITTPHIVIGLVWTPDTDEQMLRKVGPHIGWNEITIDPSWPRTGTWSAHS